MHQYLEWRVQKTDDEMKHYPNNKKPTGPVPSVQHEHAANNPGYPRDVYDPMCLEVGKALIGNYPDVRPQALKKSDGAEDYEYPADDRDWSGAFSHGYLVFLLMRSQDRPGGI